jgi:hypothetical protein
MLFESNHETSSARESSGFLPGMKMNRFMHNQLI